MAIDTENHIVDAQRALSGLINIPMGEVGIKLTSILPEDQQRPLLAALIAYANEVAVVERAKAKPLPKQS